jgi:hypothetical protein
MDPSVLIKFTKIWGKCRVGGGVPDDHNVNPLVPGLDSRHAEAVDQVDVQVQLLAQLHIQALVAGVAADEGSEEGAFQADLVSPDGLQDVGRHIFHRMPGRVAPMQVIKPAFGMCQRRYMGYAH